MGFIEMMTEVIHSFLVYDSRSTRMPHHTINGFHHNQLQLLAKFEVPQKQSQKRSFLIAKVT